MADNTPFVASTDPAAPKIADDEVSYSGDNAKVQIIQLGFVSGAEGARSVSKMPDFATAIGAQADASAAADNSTASLMSLFKRLLARLTTLIGLLPTALGTGGGLIEEGVSRTTTITVANAASVTATAVDTNGARNIGIVVDAAFDGTQIQFQVSYDNVTFVPLRDITNTLVTQTVTAGAAHDLYGEIMVWRYIKIATVTVQTGATNFVVVMRS